MTDNNLSRKDTYLIGIDDIDFQHHFFLGLINRLKQELNNPHSHDHLLALLSEVEAYARFHFISEENMMFEASYPALDVHREHHRELLNQLSARSETLETDQNKQNFDQIIDFLMQWFVNHTMSEDSLFADFLHNNNIESQAKLPSQTVNNQVDQ